MTPRVTSATPEYEFADRIKARMISLIDDWISRLLGMPIEPDLRVPAAIAACLLVVGTLLFAVATALLAIRRLRQRG